MLNRRQLLARTLQGSSLVALGSLVPEFIANTARAATPGKDNILVIIEMSGGNDGLNTVIPYRDDLYQKARPTLAFKAGQMVRVNDDLGLNPGLRRFGDLLQQGELAIVQGVGYPNPNRSHFESMDTWQTADPRRKTNTGWLGRSAAELQDRRGNVPIVHVGRGRMPVALRGTPGGAVSLNNLRAYRLELGGGSDEQHKARRSLLDNLSKPAGADSNRMLQFVQRREVQTLTTVDRLQNVLKTAQNTQTLYRRDGGTFRPYGPQSLPVRLQTVAQLIRQGFGTRVFYLALDGFDTHSNQAEAHRTLLAELADGVAAFYDTLRQDKGGGHHKRVRVMTFSEFGRRVQENGSKGTDHGAGSCLFVAGPGLKAGPVGKHPSLSDLDSGDLKYHTDFRRVYATLLDHWLGCDSKIVLGDKFEPIDALKGKG
jgi:uncharacterized protein (DUF1501 family)